MMVHFDLIGNKPFYLIAHQGTEIIDIPIDKVVSRLSKSEIRKKDRSEILDEYIKYARIEDQFHTAYGKALNEVYRLASLSQIGASVKEIITLFDLDLMKRYLVEKGYTHPTSINEVFDRQKGQNALITEDQTFIASEYMELLYLVIVVKAITPVIALSVKFNPDLYMPGLELLTAVKLIKSSWIDRTPAMDKVKRFIYKHVEKQVSDDDLGLIAMKKGIAKDDIYDFILANALFKKVFITEIQKRPLQKSAVNDIYSAISSATSNSSGVRDTINFKSSGMGGDEDSDGESWAESYRQASDLPVAMPEEFKFIASKPYDMYEHLGGKNVEMLEKALKATEPLLHQHGGEYLDIAAISMTLTEVVINSVLPATAIKYLDRASLANIMAVTFTYIYELGFEQLARYVLMVPDQSETIRQPITMSWVEKEVSEKLETIYPVMKEIYSKGEVRAEPVIMNTITKLANAVQGGNFLYIAPQEYLESMDRRAIAYSTLKSDLGRFFIRLNGVEI